jgi:hypothetical protein
LRASNFRRRSRRQVLRGALPLLALLLTLRVDAAERSLFNGQDLAGWQGNTKLWRVENGAITAGSLAALVPHNDFLVTTQSFQNFDLRVKVQLLGTEGFVNSGVQFRSVRVPNNVEMSGYQADIGEGYWGTLYDESRRGTLVPKVLDPAALQAALKPGAWNQYRIRVEGPHLQLWLNGVPTVDFTENDVSIAQDGLIGLQIHGNGKALAQYKDIVIQELPATPGAPTWEKLGGDKPDAKKP